MKISKLFHWLYAILMLLPVVLFIPTAFYYGFNHEAQAQERTELEPVYYDTNAVNNIGDLVIGNVYKYTYNINPTSNFYIYAQYILPDKYFTLSTYGIEQSVPYIKLLNGRVIAYPSTQDNYTSNIIGAVLYFVYNGFSTEYLLTEVISNISASDINIVKEYQPVVYTMSIVESMSKSLETTMDMPVISWAKTSFLVAPFQYITGLFGLSVVNPINTLLSYWLSISIIWLVFDVVMYVPLLVHKWIDKGVIS